MTRCNTASDKMHVRYCLLYKFDKCCSMPQHTLSLWGGWFRKFKEGFIIYGTVDLCFKKRITIILWKLLYFKVNLTKVTKIIQLIYLTVLFWTHQCWHNKISMQRISLYQLHNLLFLYNLLLSHSETCLGEGAISTKEICD